MLTTKEMLDIWENKPFGYFRNNFSKFSKYKKFKVSVTPVITSTEYLETETEDILLYSRNEKCAAKSHMAVALQYRVLQKAKEKHQNGNIKCGVRMSITKVNK